ncbi:hypothetical protein K2173_006919 [Erythroxylum novogranatense]|uniref:Protein TIFY n=1 Tax=Erythroxylum novogranatense TaxID=1862640 RepID=A0AAV8SZC4_9ROSI|nr:hypothetical protein K2173_006919 [Erythroxylum novogranatense]
MSRANVEMDFFGMENDCTANSRFPRRLPRQRSFRDIQSAISKINPELLKSVIASATGQQSSPGSANQLEHKKPFSLPSSPKEAFSLTPRTYSENFAETAPLTIFYNGTVAVYDVPPDKAEAILKLAERGASRVAESADEQQLLENLSGDLPIARRKSLLGFLEKRKERLTSASPLGCPRNTRF